MSRQAKEAAARESRRIQTRERRRSERLVMKEATGEINRSEEKEKAAVGQEAQTQLEELWS